MCTITFDIVPNIFLGFGIGILLNCLYKRRYSIFDNLLKLSIKTNKYFGNNDSNNIQKNIINEKHYVLNSIKLGNKEEYVLNIDLINNYVEFKDNMIFLYTNINESNNVNNENINENNNENNNETNKGKYVLTYSEVLIINNDDIPIKINYTFKSKNYVAIIKTNTFRFPFVNYEYEKVNFICPTEYNEINNELLIYSGIKGNFHSDTEHKITPNDLNLESLNLNTLFCESYNFNKNEEIIISDI